MSRFQYYTGKVILIFGSIVIGIPLGILIGLLYFFRVALSYPFSMYQMSTTQWLKQKEQKEAEKEDIWTRHIRKMEEEERVRKNSN